MSIIKTIVGNTMTSNLFTPSHVAPNIETQISHADQSYPVVIIITVI